MALILNGVIADEPTKVHPVRPFDNDPGIDDFVKNHQPAPGGAPGSIIKTPGNGARINNQGAWERRPDR
jgi:hypothetical protein